MNQDEEHLRLLSIFHYVVGGLTALFACIPIIHLVVGLAILFGAFPGNDVPPAILGLFMVVIPSLKDEPADGPTGRRALLHRQRSSCGSSAR